ncbi:MAG: FAD-dependent oxidoreductase [Lachnospiraceae bacterium]|jgi:uncharacterized FAD-dependent dehydrogenase|nr:FAD-dependent oxidoreductase [Lachnospiraceae bacterium]
MIRITELKLPINHTSQALREKAARTLGIRLEKIAKVCIRRQSLDARKKPKLFYSYSVDVELKSSSAAFEHSVIHKAKNAQIVLLKEAAYHFPEPGTQSLSHSPVIVGTGPAGLFCGLMLARHGYRPLILERGQDIEQRQEMVARFWQTGELNVHSNVQFGEGGAGTFSDGKLNTLIKDSHGRNRLVLEIFREFGADEKILYQNKPHIGTDVLALIVKRIRQEIIRLGGEIRFECQMNDLVLKQGKVVGVITQTGENIPCEALVLAIGHSARDTFFMLQSHGIPMSAKAFAVGLRIQHPQSMIDISQYGREHDANLGAADYKLTWKASDGRGVYSFCMCPGGYVVNASSEKGMLAVNGMSYHGRAGLNANSALIVTVTPEDFPENTPLAGVEFQRKLEGLAFQAGGGKIPVQLYEDFLAEKDSLRLGEIAPQMKGLWTLSGLHQILPPALFCAMKEAMAGFGQIIPGFDRPDALFAGVESRTSSPVRIWRNKALESDVKGLYPCGEGAGYAGGITSAAMDGVGVAEAIASAYQPFERNLSD